MPTSGAPGTPGWSDGQSDGDVTAQQPLFVYSCNRLGRTANPPAFSLTEWLLPRRHR